MTAKELLRILQQEKYDEKGLDVVCEAGGVRFGVFSASLDDEGHKLVLSGKPAPDFDGDDRDAQ